MARSIIVPATAHEPLPNPFSTRCQHDTQQKAPIEHRAEDLVCREGAEEVGDLAL